MPLKKFLKICMDRKHRMHQAAWQEFDRRYRNVILGRAYSVTKNKNDIQEILGKVLLRLVDRDFRALRMFRGENEKTFVAFLAKISRLAAIAYVMRNKVKQQDPLDQDIAAPQNHVDMRLVHEYLVDLVRSTLSDTLVTDYNQERDIMIMVLRKLMGFSSKEVARIPLLDTTPHNVDVVVNRLRQRIQNKLDEAD